MRGRRRTNLGSSDDGGLDAGDRVQPVSSEGGVSASRPGPAIAGKVMNARVLVGHGREGADLSRVGRVAADEGVALLDGEATSLGGGADVQSHLVSKEVQRERSE